MTETKIAEKTEKLDTTKAQAAATPEAEEKPKLFNLTQIAGGALAAVTTAAVGSRLGVAGTLVGAAIASVLAAFASTLYTKGLEQTREGVRKIVLRGGKDKDEVTETVVETRPGGTWKRPAAVGGGMLATAAVTFVVSMGVVTGWEFGTGKTLDGRTGTTIGQVGNRGSTAKPTPSASASAKPTATPSASSTASPTATATPSAAPSATPTSTTTPTPSTSASETSASPADVPQGASLG